MRIELPIGASRQDVWRALTDPRSLERWFCEHADVDLGAGRYDFWGRYTPDAPDREGGRHAALKVVERELLRYAWTLGSTDYTVEVALDESAGETTVAVTFEPDDRTLREFFTLTFMHGLRGLAEFGIEGAGRFDFTGPSSFVSTGDAGAGAAQQTVVRVPEGEDRVEVSIDIDAPREHVYGVLVTDLEDRWWVGGLRERVTYDPPRGASTPFTIDDSPASVVTWTLEDSHGRTRVSLVHSGFAWSSDDEAIAHALGWFASLCWLKFQSETGDRWRERHNRGLAASGRQAAWM